MRVSVERDPRVCKAALRRMDRNQSANLRPVHGVLNFQSSSRGGQFVRRASTALLSSAARPRSSLRFWVRHSGEAPNRSASVWRSLHSGSASRGSPRRFRFSSSPEKYLFRAAASRPGLRRNLLRISNRFPDTRERGSSLCAPPPVNARRILASDRPMLSARTGTVLRRVRNPTPKGPSWTLAKTVILSSQVNGLRAPVRAQSQATANAHRSCAGSQRGRVRSHRVAKARARVEAVPDGWWYSASGMNGQFAGRITDPSLKMGGPSRELMLNGLARAPFTQARLAQLVQP
jgi:hypothetical protein